MGRVNRVGRVRGIVAVRLKSVVPFRPNSCASWDIDDFTGERCDKWVGTSVADNVIRSDIRNWTVVGRVSYSFEITLVHAVNPKLLEDGMCIG